MTARPSFPPPDTKAIEEAAQKASQALKILDRQEGWQARLCDAYRREYGEELDCQTAIHVLVPACSALSMDASKLPAIADRVVDSSRPLFLAWLNYVESDESHFLGTDACEAIASYRDRPTRHGLREALNESLADRAAADHLKDDPVDQSILCLACLYNHCEILREQMMDRIRHSHRIARDPIMSYRSKA